MRKIVETRTRVTPCLNMQGGVTHDCASILDIIAKKSSCFSHDASPTSPFIHLNDFTGMSLLQFAGAALASPPQ